MTETIDRAVERFLAHKRALGRKYHSEERELRLLVAFAAGHGISGSPSSPRPCWRTSWPPGPGRSPRSFNHLLGVVGCLLDWAVTQELLERLAAADAPPAGDRRARSRSCSTPRRPAGCSMPRPRLPDNPRARGRGHDLPCDLRPVLRARAARRRGMRAAPGRHRRRPRAARSCAAASSARAAWSRTGRGSPRSSASRPARRAGAAASRARRRCSPSTAARSIHPCTASQVFHQPGRRARPARP